MLVRLTGRGVGAAWWSEMLNGRKYVRLFPLSWRNLFP